MGYPNGPQNHVPSVFPPVLKANFHPTLARPYLHEAKILKVGDDNTPPPRHPI